MRTAKREHYDLALSLIESGQWSVDPDAGLILGGRGRSKRPIGVLRKKYVRVRIGYKGPSVSAHRVIWEACNGPIIDPTLGVNHINGVKHDNRIANLELATNSENVQHAFDTGLAKTRDCRGELNNLAKVTEDDVRQIRDMREAGVLGREVASLFGISESAVCAIYKRNTWRHVR